MFALICIVQCWRLNGIQSFYMGCLDEGRLCKSGSQGQHAVSHLEFSPLITIGLRGESGSCETFVVQSVAAMDIHSSAPLK